jgi:hypothetical protein
MLEVGPLSGAAAQESAAGPPQDRRRPWFVWVIPFAVFFGALCGRNGVVFSRPFYESADMGANSILIEQARRFSLLVGHYSRAGFHHPGPAYLYVQAAGESLFYDMLHVVPAPWNGQLIAVYALNAAFASTTVAVVYGWTRSLLGAAACLVVLAGFAVIHPGAFASDWMPYMLVPTLVAFVVSAGSLAGGRAGDAWIAAISGWFLIHGYAPFLFFVPLILVTALATAAWPARGRLRAAAGELARTPSVWVPVVVISAAFALPIAVNLLLHWPGYFADYISFSKSSQAGDHSFAATIRYITWYWGPGPFGWAAIVLLGLGAVAATRLTRGPVRRFLAGLLIVDAVTSAGMVVYTSSGVDEINQRFIGYFYWAAPMVAVLVIAIAIVERVPPVPVLAAAAAAIALLGVSAAPGTVTSTGYVDPERHSGTSATDPGIAGAVTAVARQAHGKVIVIYLYHNAWPSVTGFLVQAERSGVRACVRSASWTNMMTRQFICTPAQARSGTDFLFHALPLTAPVPHPVAVLRESVVTTYRPAKQP